jgi:hypothetical protein
MTAEIWQQKQALQPTPFEKIINKKYEKSVK